MQSRWQIFLPQDAARPRTEGVEALVGNSRLRFAARGAGRSGSPALWVGGVLLSLQVYFKAFLERKRQL